jgi:hypothetical protein
MAISQRSYWIPGSYAPALSEKGNSFLSLLKNKGFREESMTQVGLYAIGTSTTLESNKSPGSLRPIRTGGLVHFITTNMKVIDGFVKYFFNISSGKLLLGTGLGRP